MIGINKYKMSSLRCNQQLVMRIKHLSIGRLLVGNMFLLVFFVNSGSLLSQNLVNRNSLSLDSRYFFKSYSNKAVGKFGIEVINLATFLADLLINVDTNQISDDKKFLFYDSQELQYLGNGLVLFISSAILSSSFTFAYHEYGHGTRQAAIGLKPFYGHGSIETQADINAVLSGSVELYDNFLSFYLASLFKTGGFTIVKGDSLFSPLFDEFNTGWNGVIIAGGMNNEMLFSGYIEDELYRNGGNIGFMLPYLSGKLAAQSYDSGTGVFNDLGNVVNYYQSQGYDINSEKIISASKMSFYTSSLSYQFVYQFVRMLSGNSTQFSPWEYYGFQLPNTAFFLNRRGLSYKIKSGYRFDSWRLPFAVEYIFEGEKQTEVSLGLEKQFNTITAAFEAIIGKRLGFGLEANYLLHEYVTLSGGYSLYNKENLNGERLIPSLENGSSYHDIYLRISLTF